MRKILLLLTMLVAGMMATAQITVPGTRITFEFPQGGWKYLQTTKVDNDAHVYLFVYGEKAVMDAAGDTVLPCLRVFVRNHYTDNMFHFIMERYKQQPYETLEEYTATVSGVEAFGYVAAYKDLVDDKAYQMRMVNFKDGNTAIEFRLEAPMDVYPAFEQTFSDIAATLKITK